MYIRVYHSPTRVMYRSSTHHERIDFHSSLLDRFNFKFNQPMAGQDHLQHVKLLSRKRECCTKLILHLHIHGSILWLFLQLLFHWPSSALPHCQQVDRQGLEH
uniref:Uncharacterized protein n=1 Tax=Arundo donax TaxID=35708 RepID=A0A0A9D1J8_ARUDO